MNAVLRSEFLKLRTTRSALGLLAGTVVLAGLALWGSLSSATPAELAAGLTAPFGYAGIVIIVMLFVMVLGIRSFTDEVRHGSIVPTFLATPKRLRVLAAKTTVSAAAAVVFAIAALAVGTGVVAVYLVTHGYAVPVAWGTMAWLFGNRIFSSPSALSLLGGWRTEMFCVEPYQSTLEDGTARPPTSTS